VLAVESHTLNTTPKNFGAEQSLEMFLIYHLWYKFLQKAFEF